MKGPARFHVVFALLLAGACSSSPLTLPPPAQPAREGENAERSEAPVERAFIVPGSPTDVYGLVARGANRCWFGADGPLKPTHVFHAEAESPAQGGAAEIVLHERDETLRDKRGTRAFRVAFTAVPAGARVVVTQIKIDQQLGQAMTKDAADWAKGGTECELRKQMPAQPLTPIAGKGDSRKR